MLYHLRGLFFVDYMFLARMTFLNAALYAVTGFGHQAVMVFFVLSGYFIGTSVMESVGKQQWSWRTYLVSRITRLQLVLFLSLVLGAIGTRLNENTPGCDALLRRPVQVLYPECRAPVHGSSVFWNFFFLQSVVSPVFGSNGPLWSLSKEFWY